MHRALSLRTELLLNIALIAGTAMLLAVAGVILLYGVVDAQHGALYLSILVAADVAILVAYVAYQVDRTILRPLRQAMGAAEAIADGDLARRLPPGDTLEMANLASSVNRMTDRLIDDRVHLLRAEKLASIGRLAAGVAHEIGNPLGAINGYTHLLRQPSLSPTDAQDALAGLERESARVDRIVRGLLDYARARPSSEQSTTVDVNDTARNVIELLTTQGVLKHIDLELSPAAERTAIAGDRHELEQVLVNLVLNAVDAMDGKGSLSIIVRRTTNAELRLGGRRENADGPRLHPPSARTLHWLESTRAENVVMIAVTDSGPGIPDEDADRVFEPFFTTKDPGKGTGLGLAIVARAVENFGGTIWVSRAREGGAAFRMLMPVVPTTERTSTRRVRISNERLAVS